MNQARRALRALTGLAIVGSMVAGCSSSPPPAPEPAATIARPDSPAYAEQVADEAAALARSTGPYFDLTLLLEFAGRRAVALRDMAAAGRADHVSRLSAAYVRLVREGVAPKLEECRATGWGDAATAAMQRELPRHTAVLRSVPAGDPTVDAAVRDALEAASVTP